jgi:glyceraldehyde 3-phosphate dehydrogenase
MRVAINGFGRVGRAVFRQLQDRPEVQVVAVNDVADVDALVYLLRRDTVRGPFPGAAELDDGHLVTARGRTRLLGIEDPEKLPWRQLRVEVVVEATGRFRRREEAARHLAAGAGRVVLAASARGPVDATVISGFGEAAPAAAVIAVAPPAAHALALLADALDRAFGLEHGLATVFGACRADQRVTDAAHDDLRRGRAAAWNLVPVADDAARTVGEVLPHLRGRLAGLAVRAPVPAGAALDLTVSLRCDVTPAAVNEALREAAAAPGRAHLLGCADDPYVSADVIGDPRACVFDPGCTTVAGARAVKVLAWFDSEWAGAARIGDVLGGLAAL